MVNALPRAGPADAEDVRSCQRSAFGGQLLAVSLGLDSIFETVAAVARYAAAQ
jgi:hypothetical protein